MPIDISSSKQGRFAVLLVVPDRPWTGPARVLAPPAAEGS